MRKLIATLAAAALVAGGVAAPAAAQRGRNAEQGEQGRAREQMQAGRELSPREIERRVLPQMKGHDYLGFEYDPGGAYRLKFMKDGHVTWIDVDARTGRTLRVSR